MDIGAAAAALVAAGGLGIYLTIKLSGRISQPFSMPSEPQRAAIDPHSVRLAPTYIAGITGAQGEVFYWETRAELTQYRAVHHRGYSGISVPIGPVYARVGASRGGYASEPVSDHGRLIFSDARILFAGTRGTAYVGYKRIVAIEELGPTTFRVNVEANPACTFRTASPGDVIILRRMMTGDFEHGA